MTADNATAASLSDNLSGFEILVLTTALSSGSPLDLNNLDNISYVDFHGTGAEGDNKTISTLLSGGTLRIFGN